MARLTSDKPSEKMFDCMHNIINATFVKDNDVWLKNWGGIDQPLIEVCADECYEQCGINVNAEDFPTIGCNCFVCHFYCLAIGHCELREELKKYEDREYGKEE